MLKALGSMIFVNLNKSWFIIADWRSWLHFCLISPGYSLEPALSIIHFCFKHAERRGREKERENRQGRRKWKGKQPLLAFCDFPLCTQNEDSLSNMAPAASFPSLLLQEKEKDREKKLKLPFLLLSNLYFLCLTLGNFPPYAGVFGCYSVS